MPGGVEPGKGTGIFQWLLTLGIVTAAVVGMYFSFRVEEVAKLGDAARLLAFKDRAWRSIFWVSLPPGILFVVGSLMVTESPRWLFRRGRRDAAEAALLRSRTREQGEIELDQMGRAAGAEKTKYAGGTSIRERLLQSKYVIPFVLACVILACNQATGINSIIGYNTDILLQGGLSDIQAHWGYVLFTVVNFLMTIIGVLLVDRVGRKILLSVGSAGIIVSLLCTCVLFRQTERQRVDVAGPVQAMVGGDQALTMSYDRAVADRLMGAVGDAGQEGRGTSLEIIYSCGGFRAATKVARSDDVDAKPIAITRETCVPRNRVVAFFSNPFADLAAARRAPLRIEKALITPVPSAKNGWMVLVSLLVFIAFYAMGPGVCVWLALSELMPTRIRSNGMSIALVINQAVSTGIAAFFLPTVGKYGYAAMFLGFAGCTVIYFLTAAVFLPETKGKTLEEIEAVFEGAG